MEPISIVGVLGLSLLAAIVVALVYGLVEYLRQPVGSRTFVFPLALFCGLWAGFAVILAAPTLTLQIGA